MKRSMIKISKENRIELILKYFLISISIVAFFYSAFNKFSYDYGNFGAVTCIYLLSIYLVYKSSKNWMLFAIFGCIFWFNYSIGMALYLDNSIAGFYSSFINDDVMSLGINIILLFMILLVIIFPIEINKNTDENTFIQIYNKNDIIVCFIIMILIFILITGFAKPEISGERGEPSALYEYSLIFFIIGYYFSGGKRRNIYILSLILIVFSIQNLVYGGRVVALQLITCFFIIIFSHKTKPIKMIPLILVGLIIFTSVGIFRANTKLSIDNIISVSKDIIHQKGTLDTAYSAYYSSLTFIKTKEYYDKNEIKQQFKKYVLSLMFGSGMIEGESIQQISGQFYIHYGGGILPIYLYYYIGFWGVLLTVVIVIFYIRIINNLNKFSNGWLKCLSIYITCSVFRWYLYSPNGLIRGALLMSIIFYSLSSINKVLKLKKLVYK